jgi:hypothetical protein
MVEAVVAVDNAVDSVDYSRTQALVAEPVVADVVIVEQGIDEDEARRYCRSRRSSLLDLTVVVDAVFGGEDRSGVGDAGSRGRRRLRCASLELVGSRSGGIDAVERAVEVGRLRKGLVGRAVAVRACGFVVVERRLGMEAGRIVEMEVVVVSRASHC